VDQPFIRTMLRSSERNTISADRLKQIPNFNSSLENRLFHYTVQAFLLDVQEIPGSEHGQKSAIPRLNTNASRIPQHILASSSPHIHTAHLCTVKIFIHQLMHKGIVLRTILKFTLQLSLKQLRHISVQSPSSGSALFELAKVTVVKIIN
jgi:hypothetical protein